MKVRAPFHAIAYVNYCKYYLKSIDAEIGLYERKLAHLHKYADEHPEIAFALLIGGTSANGLI